MTMRREESHREEEEKEGMKGRKRQWPPQHIPSLS